MYCDAADEFGDAHGFHCDARCAEFVRIIGEKTWLAAESQEEAVEVMLKRTEPLALTRLSLVALRRHSGARGQGGSQKVVGRPRSS